MNKEKTKLGLLSFASQSTAGLKLCGSSLGVFSINLRSMSQTKSALNTLEKKPVLSKNQPKLSFLNAKAESRLTELTKKPEKSFSAGSSMFAAFITKLMRKGKKEKAEKLLIKALKRVEQEVTAKAMKVESASLSSGPAKSLQGNQSKQGNKSKVKFELKPKEVIPVLALGGGESKVASSSLQVSVLSKVLEKIIENAKPLIRLKKVRIAGATHQKPVALTQKQAETDAIKRIIINANLRSEKSAALKLAKEFEEIYLNIMSNKTLTEVRELHKLAEANKANLTLK
jgi:ribosomal protein S7